MQGYKICGFRFSNLNICRVIDAERGAKMQWWAFACSHGGEIACIEGISGKPVWKTELPGRAEAGMAVSNDLEVCHASNVVMMALM